MKITVNAESTPVHEFDLDTAPSGKILIDNDGDPFVVTQDRDLFGLYPGGFGTCPYIAWPATVAPAGYSVTLTQEA